MHEVNAQARLVTKLSWLPEQTKSFIPLVLIQHLADRYSRESTAMTEFIEQGHIDNIVSSIVPKCNHKLENCELLQEVLNTSKVTNQVTEILAPLETSNDPQFILIEGAPGIGKSSLLEEIAYLWGTEKILKKFKLVLLMRLCDPDVQNLSHVHHLLQFFCRRNKEATEIASTCDKYFLGNSGKDVVLLFDGYDEYLHENNLITDILNRKALPLCGLIVSSRPCASLSLRQLATVKVEVLGFSTTERQIYIREAMNGQQQKIDELNQYLQSHSKINSLCYVPFNIVVLVHLYKNKSSLLKNCSELLNCFICFTIRRHLTKHDCQFKSNVAQLTNVPEPWNEVVQQLSEFSLQALNDNKITFTFDEIKVACPAITTVQGASNGCGLLHVVENFGVFGPVMTYSFLHFSIKECLAAYHIKKILFGESKAISSSDKFLRNQLQCLRLYHCFHVAGNVDICNMIQQLEIFSYKEIKIGFTNLTTTDVECVTGFLTSSFHKEWMEIDFNNCKIQDNGLCILHQGLHHCSDVTINQLWLNNNGLTVKSSSLISELTVKYKVRELVIVGNHTIGENQQLYSMLADPSNVLEELYMTDTGLSSKAAISLFKAVEDNNKLKQLNIATNAIKDDACPAITTSLTKNSCLVEVNMCDNPLTDDAIVRIVSGLVGNNTLVKLLLPKCLEASKNKIISLQEDINKNRKSQGFQVTLTINC